jgi:hypothetical protein
MKVMSDCGRFLRPLLGVTKEEITAYMKEKHYEWREDSSNAERKYKRNVLRLDVLPQMEGLAGGKDALRKYVCTLYHKYDGVVIPGLSCAAFLVSHVLRLVLMIHESCGVQPMVSHSVLTIYRRFDALSEQSTELQRWIDAEVCSSVSACPFFCACCRTMKLTYQHILTFSRLFSFENPC